MSRFLTGLNLTIAVSGWSLSKTAAWTDRLEVQYGIRQNK